MTQAYVHWLSNIEGIGASKIEILLACGMTAYHVYYMKEHQYKQIKGISGRDVAAITLSKKSWNLEREYHALQEKNIQLVSIEDEWYPKKLHFISQKPYSLYIKGSLPQETQPSVAIVGARACTTYGIYVAQQFGEEFAKYGVQVISGLASGVDANGQIGALRGGGTTYGILGCGIDICYPKENIELYMQVQKQGGVISEYPPKVLPHKGLFPRRNRLISGLADVVIVVEARERSGSLITADFALEQGKDVYAVPGRITDALSQGCNHLIQQGAYVAEKVEIIIENMGIIANKKLETKSNSKIVLEKNERLVYSDLDLQPKNIEQLLAGTKLTPQEVMSALVNLTLKGCIKEISKNHYIKMLK